MRKLFWVGIIVLSFLIPIGASIIIPILLKKFIWTPLIIVISIEAVIGIIFLIIILIAKLSKKPKIPEEIDIKDAEKKAIIDSLTDESDPDNFLIFDKKIYKIGEKGIAEKTPILILKGYGTETNTQRVAIINLKNIEKEITWLKGEKATDEEIDKWAIRIAESQPEEEREKITTSYQFGMPTMTKETVRPSPNEIKKEKEKEEAESKNII